MMVMDGSMLRSLLSLVAIPSVLAAQDSGLLRQAALPPPPPPPRVERPPTPARIHVGCGTQSAYIGPAQQWHSSSNSLSDAQIAELESELSSNPDDTCARGYLIAHGGGLVSHWMDHVQWMIEHHPEWDGFLLNGAPSAYWDDQAADIPAP